MQNASISDKTSMKNKDLATQRDVITLGDYDTCPTIKSNNPISTIVVVKSDENIRSIKAGSNNSDDNHYKSIENRAVGVSLL
jgi:hypothetical protein